MAVLEEIQEIDSTIVCSRVRHVFNFVICLRGRISPDDAGENMESKLGISCWDLGCLRGRRV